MGQRAGRLESLLNAAGLPSVGSHRRPGWDDLRSSGLSEPVVSMYVALGGLNALPRIRPGAWDLSLEGFVVELDEERHFNRYRALTLGSDLYGELKLPLADYRNFCQEREGNCLRAAGWAGNWTNPSAEREFGAAGPERALEGAGSPRWKQRAFYDFVKDLAPLCVNLPVARLSIWELFDVAGERHRLGDLLMRRDPTRERAVAAALRDVVRVRADQPFR
jgi:hypothetical protein